MIAKMKVKPSFKKKCEVCGIWFVLKGRITRRKCYDCSPLEKPYVLLKDRKKLNGEKEHGKRKEKEIIKSN